MWLTLVVDDILQCLAWKLDEIRSSPILMQLEPSGGGWKILRSVIFKGHHNTLGELHHGVFLWEEGFRDSSVSSA